MLIPSVHIHEDFMRTVSALSASLEYFTDRDGKFECVVSGGHPKPNVALYIGNDTKNVVALFAPHMIVDKKIRGDTVGLKNFEYTVTRSSNSFRLKPERDGAKIRCVGSVGNGVDDVVQEVVVLVIGRSCWTFVQFQTPELNIMTNLFSRT